MPDLTSSGKQDGAARNEDEEARDASPIAPALPAGKRLPLQPSELLSIHGHLTLLYLNDNHYCLNVKINAPVWSGWS
ncbi:hypothetical protein [Chromobacterium haemolyticum]|uniref:hypothetical protein n=1 Tax=Chromobacterium TaxID=535 RepID=UPI00405709BA